MQDLCTMGILFLQLPWCCLCYTDSMATLIGTPAIHIILHIQTHIHVAAAWQSFRAYIKHQNREKCHVYLRHTGWIEYFQKPLTHNGL